MAYTTLKTIFLQLIVLDFVFSQLPTIPQNVTFNSTFSLFDAEIKAAGINESVAGAVELALNFERTNWAPVSVLKDDFYTLPPNASNASPGDLLKVEYITNTTFYTLPPSTALSRVVYVTETLDGKAIPASAYILWPYSPRTTKNDRYPIVAWGHGYSGFTAECAPSHVRDFFHNFGAPYPLALSGYVVVAPDFAGLGVDQTADETLIDYAFGVNDANANDLIYAVQAAQTAFTQLSTEFVVMGHSAGSMAAWATAIRQIPRPVTGYLGAVVVSPWWADFLQLPLSPEDEEVTPFTIYVSALIAHTIQGLFPDFQLSDFLTETGIKLYNLILKVGGCASVHQTLLAYQSPDALHANFTRSSHFRAYAELTRNAGKEIAGPVLILQAIGDPVSNSTSTTRQVNQTCEAFPQSDIEYQLWNVTGHATVLYAAQTVWLDWIVQRFASVDAESNHTARGCSSRTYNPEARPLEAYQGTGVNYFLEYATADYQLA